METIKINPEDDYEERTNKEIIQYFIIFLLIFIAAVGIVLLVLNI